MARLTPKPNVIRRLFALSGNVCAFPECNHKLINSKSKFIAQVCHIEAAEEGGERYNPTQTDEQRRAFENLMLMCYQHHVETDDVLAFPVEVLQEMKSQHERRNDGIYQLPEDISDDIIYSIQQKLELVYGIVTENNQLIKDGLEISKGSQAALSQLKEMVEQLNTKQVANIDESTIHSEQLDFIKKLRKENKPETALEAALNFKNGKWAALGDELKFKLIANIAAILFDLGRQEDAARELLALTDVLYENGETKAYIALAYALLHDRDNFEKTFKQALEINNRSVNLWVGYLYMVDKDTTFEAIKQRIPADILEKSEVLFALGNIYLERGLVDEGLELLDSSMAKIDDTDASKWHIQGIYASKILTNIITVEKVVFNRFTEQDLTQIRRAINILSKAWEEVRDTELAKSGWHMLMNRGTAYKSIGEDELAEVDLAEAFRLSEKFDPLKNLVLHYIDRKRLDKASALVNSVNSFSFDNDESFELNALKARILTLEGNVEQAVATLVSISEQYEGELRVRLIDLITLIYFEAGAYTKAEPFAKQLIELYPDWPNGYLAYAICLSRDNKIDLAILELDKAFARADKSVHKRLTLFQIGVEYKDLKAYDKAAEVFEGIVDFTRYDQTFRNLILCQYHNGDLDECITSCVKAKALNPSDVTVDEVLFRAYDEKGRYGDAETVLKSILSSIHTDSFDHFRLLGILMFKKIGERGKALKLALEISNYSSLSLPQRMGVARVLLEEGSTKEGLEVAYDARADYYDTSNSHSSYIQTLAIRQKREEDDFYPANISLDTAFVVKDGVGSDRTFFLTDDKRIGGSQIIRSTDSLATKVVGKSIGDIVEVGNSVGSGSKLTITTIFNKYTYAFRDSHHLLETRYADESGFIFFKGDDTTSIQDFIRTQSIKANSQKEQLYKLYSNDAATIGMIAEYLGKTQIDVWMEFVSSTTASILSYTHDEYNDIAVSASEGKPIVIDCTALLTIFLLFKRPELLTATNLQLLVTTSTIEELIAFKESIYDSGPGMSVGVDKGVLTRFERTQQDIDRQISEIEAIIAWCKQHCTIITPKRVGKTIGRTDDVVEMIGNSSYDTLLLASQMSGVVLSDDEKLKSLGLGTFSLPAFSSYQLIIFSTRNEIIKPQDFTDLYRILIRANYRYIPVTGPDLWLFFDESSFRIDGSFVTAVQGLSIMRSDLVGFAVAAFAKSVYLNLSVPSLRTSVLTYVLRGLKKHRDYPRIIPVIKTFAAMQFNLMPQYGNEFLQLVAEV